MDKEAARVGGNLIRALVAKSNAKNRASAELDAWCEERYGFSPSDIDCDEILDGVYGYCGQSEGMTVTQFDKAMKDSIRLAERSSSAI